MEAESHAGRHNARPTPAVRGTRACTVCRQAKMKCVSAGDGHRACIRCQKAGLECVFEKHRRGRKPGSKLSEASKMLRLLEKSLNTVKTKRVRNVPSPTLSPKSTNSRTHTKPGLDGDDPNSVPPPDANREEEDDDDEHDAMIPTRVITREQRRTSFFRTILNERSASPNDSIADNGTSSGVLPGTFIPKRVAPPLGYQTPVSMEHLSEYLSEAECLNIFDMIYLRLNLFINLLDPYLHSHDYVRSKCPFLYVTLLAGGCRFFKGEVYSQVRQLAKRMAVRAFEEEWKSVEVCQAFACLTYWKDVDETNTWTYIGYACRLAVELGLDKYHANPLPKETDLQRRERRNRERTYLVLWVHDRSLSMQTGRQWMLPEGPLVANSNTWHLSEEVKNRRPEDVTVAAFVQLRRIGAEATDVFLGKYGAAQPDEQYELELQRCNAKLDRWSDHWENEMKQAGGQDFQISMLSFFKLHVRLFLNTFGLHSGPHTSVVNLQAVLACYESGLQSLHIVSLDFFDRFKMLPYCQDSVTVMTAYSAICLLWLLRKPELFRDLPEQNAQEKIYAAIDSAANAFGEAVLPGQASESPKYQSRFLKSLLERDKWMHSYFPATEPAADAANLPLDVVGTHGTTIGHLNFSNAGLNPFIHIPHSFSTTENLEHWRGDGRASGQNGSVQMRLYQAQASPDERYWRNMHVELGMNGILHEGGWQAGNIIGSSGNLFPYD